MRSTLAPKGWKGKFKSLATFVGLLVAGLYCLCYGAQARAAQNISLAWNASTDANVTGYAVYYGTNSGSYFGRIDAGSNTTVMVPQLNDNTAYYFVVTAYNSAGSESLPSGEISFSTPGSIVVTPAPPGSLPIVHFTAVTGHWYELQASSDLVSWTTILICVPGMKNSTLWYSEMPASVPYQRRFYRYVQH